MFGFKLVKESDYQNMVELVERHTASHKSTEIVIKNLKKELESLRRQNGEFYEANKELERLHKSKNVKFDDLFELHIDQPHCSECKKEQPGCRKWQVGDHTVCITEKPSFRKKK